MLLLSLEDTEAHKGIWLQRYRYRTRLGYALLVWRQCFVTYTGMGTVFTLPYCVVWYVQASPPVSHQECEFEVGVIAKF